MKVVNQCDQESLDPLVCSRRTGRGDRRRTRGPLEPWLALELCDAFERLQRRISEHRVAIAERLIAWLDADPKASAAHLRGERVWAHLEAHGHAAIAHGHLCVSHKERRAHVI